MFLFGYIHYIWRSYEWCNVLNVFFFSNGNLDPWMSGGVTKSLSESLVALMIDGGAHHLDLRYNNEFDPESVIKTRLLEVQYFKQWIKQGAFD